MRAMTSASVRDTASVARTRLAICRSSLSPESLLACAVATCHIACIAPTIADEGAPRSARSLTACRSSSNALLKPGIGASTASRSLADSAIPSISTIGAERNTSPSLSKTDAWTLSRPPPQIAAPSERTITQLLPARCAANVPAD